MHENKTELLETFTAIFRTEKTENISTSGMRNHYYSDDAAIGRSVKTLKTTTMMNTVNLMKTMKLTAKARMKDMHRPWKNA